MPREIAEILVHRLVCQQISQRVIRMFSPEAVFAVVKYSPEIQRYIPTEMPPAEVENVKCAEVKPVWPDPAPRMRNLPRYREVHGDSQLLISKGSKWQWPEGMEPALAPAL